MKNRLPVILALLMAFCVIAPVAIAQSEFSEYDVQAAYLYKFISFVEWPAERVPQDIITIGVLGDNPFGDAFEDVEGLVLGDRTLVVKYFERGVNSSELEQCQVLYICSSESKYLKSICTALEGSPVLTIGDSKNFAKNGGGIGFVRVKGKVKFEINNTAAEKAQLSIRSMLKRIAVRVIK